MQRIVAALGHPSAEVLERLGRYVWLRHTKLFYTGILNYSALGHPSAEVPERGWAGMYVSRHIC